jgi:membrane protein DedA with SNARE-associated domain
MTLVIVAIVIAAFLIVALIAYWLGWRHGQMALTKHYKESENLKRSLTRHH